MTTDGTRWCYSIGGVPVVSDFRFFGGVESEDGDASDRIRVRLASVPCQLDGAVSFGPTWQSAPSSFLLDVPGVVRFIVTDGTDIVVEPAAGVPLEDAAIFVAGTAVAIALYQRGALVLHASAVVRRGRAFAFTGASGAGKSTLAALLCRRSGCEMLSDDVSVIDLGGESPVLRADGRQFRLWEDVLEWMDPGERQRTPVRTSIRKFYVEAPPRRAGMIAPLSGIYLLKPLPDGSTPAIERVPLSSAAALLDRNLYRRRLSDHLGDRSARFGQIARLLATVPIYLFSRSVGVADNPRALDCLEAHWNTGR